MVEGQREERLVRRELLEVSLLTEEAVVRVEVPTQREPEEQEAQEAHRAEEAAEAALVLPEERAALARLAEWWCFPGEYHA